MSRLFYAAASPSGHDFESTELIYRPGEMLDALDADSPLHASAIAGEVLGLCGVEWPMRLFAVEGTPYEECDLSGHFHFEQLRVVEELPAHAVFGPQGEAVIGLIERAAQLSAAELESFAEDDAVVDVRTISERMASMAIMAHEADLSAAHSQARRLATDAVRFAGNLTGVRSLSAQLAAADCVAALVICRQLPRPLFRMCSGAWMCHTTRSGAESYMPTLSCIQSVTIGG